MEKKILIQYIRDENRCPTGIVLATGKNKIGWSLLHGGTLFGRIKKDKWNKKIGFQIALSRAEKGVDWKEFFYKKHINETHFKKKYPRIFNELIPVIEKMQDRAKKYYK